MVPQGSTGTETTSESQIGLFRRERDMSRPLMGKTCPVFWENKFRFPSGSGNTQGHSHPPSLFALSIPSHLLSNTAPCLNTHTLTLMQTDVNTHTLTLVAHVVSGRHRCQSLPALLSLSLASSGDDALASDTAGFPCHCSRLSLCVYRPATTWKRTRVWLGRCGPRRRYGATNGTGPMTHTCSGTQLTSPSICFFSSISVCLFLYLSPASFHPGLDLKFHSKGAISAPLTKWVITQLAVPTLNS